MDSYTKALMWGYGVISGLASFVVGIKFGLWWQLAFLWPTFLGSVWLARGSSHE